MIRSRLLTFSAGEGKASALYLCPANARALLVFGHGAGAGMRHGFMEEMSQRLSSRGIATFRYQFPYMEKRIRRPDPQPVLLDTVRSAVEEAKRLSGTLPLFAGGKSMGGRMTSLAAASEGMEGVRGIIFFGFPLHPAGRPGTDRAKHLSEVRLPMLFLAGTRDKLSDLNLLRAICTALPQAELHIVEGGDHSFNVLKRSGRTPDQVFESLAGTVADWIARIA
ncbi:MAG: alpha/beta hydrolase [Bacteroidia bacterium]|nr:MAG: alpha/beta hydrolase [Bacteroidia bacterium]